MEYPLIASSLSFLICEIGMLIHAVPTPKLVLRSKGDNVPESTWWTFKYFILPRNWNHLVSNRSSGSTPSFQSPTSPHTFWNHLKTECKRETIYKYQIIMLYAETNMMLSGNYTSMKKKIKEEEGRQRTRSLDGFKQFWLTWFLSGPEYGCQNKSLLPLIKRSYNTFFFSYNTF